MNKLKLLIIGVLPLLVLVGCNKTFDFPTESDFTLMSNVSNHKPKLGEEFEVNAVLQNSATSNYKIMHGPELIGIYVVDLGQPESPIIKTGPGRTTDLKAKKNITRSHKLKFEQAGKYEIVINADFSISNQKTNEQKTYHIMAEPIVIEVK